MTETVRCYLYSRVSTDDQSAGMQVEEMRGYAKLRGWQIVEEFTETASGAKRDRVELARMLAGVKAGKADMVLVWRFDRAARSVSHLLEILDHLRLHGCDFASLHDNVDTSTATGRLLFTIIAAFAEFERRVIIERTKAGMAEAKRKGKRIGRPKRILNQGDIERVVLESGSWRKAAKRLGIPVSTLRNRCTQRGTVTSLVNPLTTQTIDTLTVL